MNQSSNFEPVRAVKVAEQHRLRALPQAFGSAMSVVEGSIYGFAGTLFEAYRGGYWEFYALSNGGFFMALSTDTPIVVTSPNGFSVTMSAEAAGVVACLFAYSHLAFDGRYALYVTEHFHKLRDYALDHAEASAILAAVD